MHVEFELLRNSQFKDTILNHLRVYRSEIHISNPLGVRIREILLYSLCNYFELQNMQVKSLR